MNTVRCRFCDFVRRDDDNRPKPNRASQCFHHLYTGCNGQSEKPEIVRLTCLATRWAQVWCASFLSRFQLSNLHNFITELPRNRFLWPATCFPHSETHLQHSETTFQHSEARRKGGKRCISSNSGGGFRCKRPSERRVVKKQSHAKLWDVDLK